MKILTWTILGLIFLGWVVILSSFVVGLIIHDFGAGEYEIPDLTPEEELALEQAEKEFMDKSCRGLAVLPDWESVGVTVTPTE